MSNFFCNIFHVFTKLYHACGSRDIRPPVGGKGVGFLEGERPREPSALAERQA